MKTKRLLIALAVLLLSIGVANAQSTQGDDNGTPTNEVVQGNDDGTPTGETTGEEKPQVEITSGDVNNDGKLNIDDVTAAADSVMKNVQSGSADVYKDQKVNALDVVTVVNLIKEANYFLLGTEVPTEDTYTTIDGVVTDYKSLDEVLKAAPTISLEAEKTAVILCPEGWEASDLALQNEEDGTFYALAPAETDISGYNLFQTEPITAAATYKLKTLADAEAYKKIKETDFFYLGTEVPTEENYTTLDGVITDYKSILSAIDAGQTVRVEADQTANLLCPAKWWTLSSGDPGIVLQNEADGTIYVFYAVPCSISGYNIFQTEKMTAAATLKLKQKADADDYKESLTPKDPEYFWLGNTMPTKNNFPMLGGEEVPGIVLTYTSLDDAMAKASRNYRAGEYAVVLYPKKWGTKDGLVFYDKGNKKYYAVKKKDVADFPDYIYYETAKKIGANTIITLSTETAAKAAGATLYEETTPTTPTTPTNPSNPTTPTTPVTPSGDGSITFTIQNQCGYEVRLSGRVTLNISPSPSSWGSSFQVSADIHGPNSGASWAYNDISIPAGGTYSWKPSISPAYTAGNYYFMSADKDQYIWSIYLYSRIYRTSKGKTEGSTAMYHVKPLSNTPLKNGMAYTFVINQKNADASLYPDVSKKYVIMALGQKSL